MAHSQAFGHRFVRYLAIIFGPGLMGWGIAGSPAGFAIGIGAGIVVAGAVWRFAVALETDLKAALEPPPQVRISLDQDDFARLIRGQVVGHPGGVRIALRDIGWTVMLAEIQRAHREAVDVS